MTTTLDDARDVGGTEMQPARAARVATNPGRRRDRIAALAVALLLLGTYWSTMGGHTYSVDDETYLAATRALVQGDMTLDLGPDIDEVVVTVLDKNGDPTTMASIGTLVLLVPGFVAGKLIATPFAAGSEEEIVRLVTFSTNGLLTAITGALLFFLCRELGAGRRWAAALALTFGLATWAWPHSQTNFSEPGTAMFLTASVLAAVRWWRHGSGRGAFLVGLLIGCTVITRSSTLLFVPILFASGVLRRDAGPLRERARQTLMFCAGGALPGLAFAWSAWVRFGNPVDPGYPPLSYTTPFYEGVYGLFLSPGKGALLYAPILVVALFALRTAFLAERRYVVVTGCLLGVHLAVYSRFQIWSGDNAYGPRYMTPLLPIMVALIAPVIDRFPQYRRGVTVAAVAGFVGPALLGSLMYFNAVYWLQGPGVAEDLELTSPTQSQQFIAWNFQPRSSPLILHLRSVPDLVRHTADRMGGGTGSIGSPPPVPYEVRIHWHAGAVELDTWWAWWSIKRGPKLIYLLLAIPIAALATGVLLLRRLQRTAAA